MRMKLPFIKHPATEGSWRTREVTSAPMSVRFVDHRNTGPLNARLSADNQIRFLNSNGERESNFEVAARLDRWQNTK
jgi:hypothetical protein